MHGQRRPAAAERRRDGLDDRRQRADLAAGLVQRRGGQRARGRDHRPALTRSMSQARGQRGVVFLGVMTGLAGLKLVVAVTACAPRRAACRRARLRGCAFSASSMASAVSSTWASCCFGITTTPSASPRTMSPGCTRASPMLTGDVGRLDLHPVLAGAHPVVLAEHRVADARAQRHVAAHAVDHGAGDAAAVRDLGQDVAPDGGVVAPAVVEHDHAAGRHVVDVVAHGAGRVGRRAVEQRPGAAGHAEAAAARLDAVALAGDAELVERVGERGGVELGRARDVGGLVPWCSVLQHVFVVAAHHLADRRAGEDGLGHRGLLGDDRLGGVEHALDVALRR